ncbi:unnamed protein product [Natator depressus]
MERGFRCLALPVAAAAAAAPAPSREPEPGAPPEALPTPASDPPLLYAVISAPGQAPGVRCGAGRTAGAPRPSCAHPSSGGFPAAGLWGDLSNFPLRLPARPPPACRRRRRRRMHSRNTPQPARRAWGRSPDLRG